jgi:peptide/nickel transport system permease protein
MARYIVRRLLQALPVLLIVSLVTFAFANLAPGDPLSFFIRPGTDAKPADLERLRQALGLDQPIHVRYLAWLGEVLQGNLGNSIISKRPVEDMLLEKTPNSLLLMGVALTISISAGVLLGVFSAFRAGSRVDRSLSLVVFGGISVPSYLLSLFAMMTLVVLPFQLFGFRLLPAGGMTDRAGDLPGPLDLAWHTILPALVLAFAGTAVFLRYTRASVLDAMGMDHVTAARSKGLAEQTIRFRHVLRNALLPVITVIGLSLPALFTGALFVETLFSWPGVGKMAVDATLQHDYPVIMAIAMATAFIIVIANLVTDLAYAVVDPRIRYG